MGYVMHVTLIARACYGWAVLKGRSPWRTARTLANLVGVKARVFLVLGGVCVSEVLVGDSSQEKLTAESNRDLSRDT